MNRRKNILLGLLGLALWIVAATSYGYMSSARTAADAAQADLAEGLRLMAQIDQLSRQPAAAADRERQATETTSQIESAAQAAGIEPASLRLISPDAPRRLGDTAYKEKPTQVLLQSVSLEQVVQLASAEPLAEAGLRVQSIRLSVPRQAEARDLWDADLVFTYLVYDPPQAGN